VIQIGILRNSIILFMKDSYEVGLNVGSIWKNLIPDQSQEILKYKILVAGKLPSSDAYSKWAANWLSEA